MQDEPLELPVFVVNGSNWSAEVELDEHNSQFDAEAQCMESSTRVIEALYGDRDDVNILMKKGCEEEKPRLETTMSIYIKGYDKKDSAIVFTHICMANNGYYKDSIEMEKLLESQVEEISKKQKKGADEAEQTRLLFEEIKKRNEKKNKKNKKVPPTEGDNQNN